MSVWALLRDLERAARGNPPRGKGAEFGRSWKRRFSVINSRANEAFRSGRCRSNREHAGSGHEGGVWFAAVVDSGSPPRPATLMIPVHRNSFHSTWQESFKLFTRQHKFRCHVLSP